MHREEIRQTVVAEIVKLGKQKKAASIKDNLNLELDLGIDSLNRVELASNLLDIFHMEDAPIEEAVQLATVGDVVAFIEKLVNSK